MMQVKDLTLFIESLFPVAVQENYDNSGMQVGHLDNQVTGVMVCLNVTQQVLLEAAKRNCNLVISHHPMIFSGLKRITGATPQERLVEYAIMNKIAVYSVHTNADKSFPGLNSYLATLLQLNHVQVLSPEKGTLRKIVTFCPETHAEKVRKAMFDAGAGCIGEYDSCSFNVNGIGTFRGREGSTPFVGQKGTLHNESEIRIETIYPEYLQNVILSALLDSHPYEEVAYDIYKIENKNSTCGLGVTGFLPQALSQEEFLKKIKETFKTPCLKFSGSRSKSVSKLAICGGSGASLTSIAQAAKADAYVTADIKYHEFDHGFSEFILVDAGHYETEIFFKQYIVGLLKKNFTNFAIHFAESEKNHIMYY
jgi:dinuclear metal center YbgI/SA1388 family protein